MHLTGGWTSTPSSRPSSAAAGDAECWATTTVRLRLGGRTVARARAPRGSNGDLVLEGAGQLLEVETAQDPEALPELGSEDLVMESVLQPPDLLTRDVPLRGRSEPNAARLSR